MGSDANAVTRWRSTALPLALIFPFLAFDLYQQNRQMTLKENNLL
jgi:hypothetical protein